MQPLLRQHAATLQAEPVKRDDFAGLVPPDAVHQGIALAVEPLTPPSLAALLSELSERPAEQPQVICVLDQVTDPQNVGSILRSAAAFGAAAVIATQRHAASESGALAKAASGALERVPYLQVPNLSQALERIKGSDFWALGLASDASSSLADSDAGRRVALVLGSEGSGLRRLTQENCDFLARLPTRPPLDQLNVATAAAVAFYELLGRRPA